MPSSKTPLGFILIAFGLILITVPLLILVILNQPSQTSAFGAIIIGPIPIIISGESPLIPIILVGAFIATLALFIILARRAQQPTPEDVSG
ncbi:MAG: hypothetical protein QW555_06415 [Nitrososphaerota archaeon]